MMKSPIVFIHMGNPRYLKKNIKLAERYNNEVYLIGDESNRRECRNWIDAGKLETNAYDDFEKLYVHMSTNKMEFELGCIKRYYLLYAFMNKINIETCFMLDSDVCVYKKLNEISFDDYDIACSVVDDGVPNIWCATPHSSFWKISALESFLRFLNNSYAGKDSRLEQIWNYHKKNSLYGGISDMVLLRLWINDIKPKWKNLAEIESGEVYDDNINCACNCEDQCYQMRTLLFGRKIKLVIFEKKKPYFIRESGEKIAVNVIHAQGEAKMYISCFTKFRNCFFYYYIADIYHDSTTWISKMFGRNRV